MADLRCAVENCMYNNSQCCCKGDIMVGGMRADQSSDTCCESFHEERPGQTTNSFNDHPSQTISIDCEAVKCIYNTNYRCHAEHVDILGCGADDCRQTACGTFQERAK